MRKCTHTLAIMLVSLVAALFLGEIGLRLLGHPPRRLIKNTHFTSHWAQLDDALGWMNRPGTFESIEPGHVPMHFTEDHRRVSGNETELAGRKASVVLVGCSYTQGYGLPDEQTMAALLNSRFPDITFLNFGTAGYSTYQSLLLLERILNDSRYAPSMVIYGYIPHHNERNYATYSWAKSLTDSDGRYLVAPHARLKDGALVFHGMTIIDPWPLETRSAFVTLLHDAWLQYGRYAAFGTDEMDAITAQLIVMLRDACAKKGIRFAVLALHEPATPAVRKLAESGQITFADCQKEIYGQPEYRIGGTGHPNARVQAEWADCIARHIDFAALIR